MSEFEYKINEIILELGYSLELLSLIDLNKKNKSRVFKLSKDELITELIGKFVDLLEELKDKNIAELENICNQYNIIFNNTSKKEDLLVLIFNYLQINNQFTI
jgi:hypothetical protein